MEIVQKKSEENQCQKKSVELHLHANPCFSRSFAARWCAASNDGDVFHY